MSMVIGVDGNDANVEQKVGVSVYTYNLLSYFQNRANNQTQFNVYLRESPHEDLPKENEFYKYKVVKGPKLWSQFFLPLNLNFIRGIDAFFSPAHYSPRFCPVPLIVTIHDLAYFYYPDEFLKKDLFKLKNWTKYSVDHAKQVIAVSENTKKDLMKFYQVPPNKITVVYNGFEKKTVGETPWSKVSSTFNLQKEKYILYVGTLQPRKNVPVLIEAFTKFHKENQNMKLVIVGKKGWLYDSIFDKAQKSGLTDQIIFSNYLPDEDVVTLYKNAYCFVLPSLYEGFGVPLLEAMSYSCPVISSFTSSLAEVGGDACVYFDPEKPHGLVEDLESLKNKKLRNELIKKGKDRTALYSWNKCAEQTLKVIKNV